MVLWTMGYDGTKKTYMLEKKTKENIFAHPSTSIQLSPEAKNNEQASITLSNKVQHEIIKKHHQACTRAVPSAARADGSSPHSWIFCYLSLPQFQSRGLPHETK